MGQVEVDETFIGGKARNMHNGCVKRRSPGLVARTKRWSLASSTWREGPGHSHREPPKEIPSSPHPGTRRTGAEVFTDALKSYDGLNPEYVHQVVDHAVEYVKGHVHTNGLENFWSLLKRTLKGTYVSVEPFHLFRYLDEQAFRYNERKDEHGDGGRFKSVVRGCSGKRLTYNEVTGKVANE